MDAKSSSLRSLVFSRCGRWIRWPASALALAVLFLGGAALVPQAARAALLPHGEQTFLYISANGVHARDVGSGSSIQLTYVAEGRPIMPARALNGAGISWTHWPLTGTERVYLQEEVTVPGSVTNHLLQKAVIDPPRVSPDGSRLLYAVEDPDPQGGILTNMYVYDAATKTSQLLVPLAQAADWSPAGTHVAYVDYPASRTDPQGVMLYLLELGTKQISKISVARRLNLNEINIYSPRWSPSGQWIAFQRLDFGAGTASVVITTPQGTSEQVVLTVPQFELGRGMEWVRLPGGAERLYAETAVPGAGPYRLAAVPGPGGFAGSDSILHASFTFQGWPEFDDVAAGSSFANDIRDLAALRVIGGYEDATFRSGEPVKRAQYAKMISIALGLHDTAWTGWLQPAFPDVPRPASQDEEFRYPYDYVQEAAGANLIKGDTTGRFKPWDPITRVQLALMIARAGEGELEPAAPADYLVFTDTAGLSAEARDAVALAYHNGLIKGKTASAFAPYAQATRGQVAAMTARLMRAVGLITGGAS